LQNKLYKPRKLKGGYTILKYQTNASIAEKQAIDALRNEINIHKSWSLVSSKLHNRTLQTTSAEVPLIFREHASVRPGFEVDEESVYVPNLFAKVSGYDIALDLFNKPEILKHRENCFFHKSIKDFCDTVSEDSDVEQYLDENGNIFKEKLLASDKFHYSFLRREYQNILIDKKVLS
jgi:hypothetical protein